MGGVKHSLAAVLAGVAVLITGSVHATAPATTIYATQSGKPAFDGDDFGGNPFASAFIAALGEDAGDDRATLVETTMAQSGGEQQPDLGQAAGGLELVPKGRAVALVIAFADYGDASDGFGSLPGAAFDATRVRAALSRAGYRAKLAVVANREDYLARVARFARDARRADGAVLYTTGHGMEVAGETWLIPPGFDASDRVTPLGERAIRVSSLRGWLGARTSNLIAYAGCRDNPMGLD